MPPPVYAWLYEDPFHSIFLATTATSSLFSNGLLLYIIFTTTRSSGIGSYQCLLVVFAICDIIASVAQASFPAVRTFSFSFYLSKRLVEKLKKKLILEHAYDSWWNLLLPSTWRDRDIRMYVFSYLFSIQFNEKNNANISIT